MRKISILGERVCFVLGNESDASRARLERLTYIYDEQGFHCPGRESLQLGTKAIATLVDQI